MQDEKLPSRVEETLATARAARTACENELTAEILKSFKCIMDSPDTGIHLTDNTFEDRLTDLSSLGLDIPRETAQHIRAFFCGHNGKEAVSALQTAAGLIELLAQESSDNAVRHALVASRAVILAATQVPKLKTDVGNALIIYFHLGFCDEEIYLMDDSLERAALHQATDPIANRKVIEKTIEHTAESPTPAPKTETSEQKLKPPHIAHPKQSERVSEYQSLYCRWRGNWRNILIVEIMKLVRQISTSEKTEPVPGSKLVTPTLKLMQTRIISSMSVTAGPALFACSTFLNHANSAEARTALDLLAHYLYWLKDVVPDELEKPFIDAAHLMAIATLEAAQDHPSETAIFEFVRRAKRLLGSATADPSSGLRTILSGPMAK
jgi:hypothetical protein